LNFPANNNPDICAVRNTWRCGVIGQNGGGQCKRKWEWHLLTVCILTALMSV